MKTISARICQLIHPSQQKQKIYTVQLDSELSPEEISKIEQGIELEDGSSKMSIKQEGDNTYQATIGQGRNRQIRRTFESLGKTVVKLHRTDIGPYNIGGLTPGEYAIVDKIN